MLALGRRFELLGAAEVGTIHGQVVAAGIHPPAQLALARGLQQEARAHAVLVGHTRALPHGLPVEAHKARGEIAVVHLPRSTAATLQTEQVAGGEAQVVVEGRFALQHPAAVSVTVTQRSTRRALAAKVVGVVVTR